MSERMLGIGLGLLTVALLVGPIVMAFQANDWNLKSTIFPGQGEIVKIESKIQSITESSPPEESVSFERTEISGDEISLKITFASPLEPDMEPLDTVYIDNLSLKLSDKTQGDEIATLKLEEAVEIGPGETESITLSGIPTPGGSGIIGEIDDPTIEDLIGISEITGNLEFRIAGVEFELPLEKLMEGIVG